MPLAGAKDFHVLEWMGLNLYYHDGLQPKMSAEMIKEHECIIIS